MSMHSEVPAQGLFTDLGRLARFGANILDAHSCFIFLPASCLVDNPQSGQEDVLRLVGAHSLSTSYIENCSIKAELGLIGWVARNGRSIHVSPFERDSRILGVYREDQQLKSFLGIPVPLEKKQTTCGVVACDSKKAFAFSKLQGKLLEELGAEVGAVVELHRKSRSLQSNASVSWETFIARGQALADTVGHSEVAALRIRAANYPFLELQMGTGGAIKFVEQVYRLIGQAIAPHCPIFKTPLGELIVIIDSMMAQVYENKLSAIANHTALNGLKVELQFSSKGFNQRHEKFLMLDKLISATSFDHANEVTPQPKKVLNFR